LAQVVDASVAIAWCATTQANPLTDATFEAVAARGGHVPSVFWFEVLYVLAGLEQRRVVTAVDVDTFTGKLAVLALTVDASYASPMMEALQAMARRYRLNIYDAAYLELALRTGLPLATRDEKLARAAEQAGVTLFTP
jgi:predicted nucleic acid-binding protein